MPGVHADEQVLVQRLLRAETLDAGAPLKVVPEGAVVPDVHELLSERRPRTVLRKEKTSKRASANKQEIRPRARIKAKGKLVTLVCLMRPRNGIRASSI